MTHDVSSNAMRYRRCGFLGTLTAFVVALSAAPAPGATVIPSATPFSDLTVTVGWDNPTCTYRFGADADPAIAGQVAAAVSIARARVVVWSGSFFLCPLTFDGEIPPSDRVSESADSRVFTDAGLYQYFAAPRPNAKYQIYVEGTRARLDATPTTAIDWTQPLTYKLDASSSEVIDYAPSTGPFYSIKKYEFDLNGDGIFELDNGTNPVAYVTLPGPGTYHPAVRVTSDDPNDNQDVEAASLNYPRPVSAVVSPPAPDDTAPVVPSGTKVTVAKRAKLKLIAPRKVKRRTLRQIGYVIRVLGLNPGDNVRASMTGSKKRLTARTSVGDGFSSRRTIRLKVKKRFDKILNRLRGKRMQLKVVITGADGFHATKIRSVTLRRRG